jgi:hypothetical protein
MTDKVQNCDLFFGPEDGGEISLQNSNFRNSGHYPSSCLSFKTRHLEDGILSPKRRVLNKREDE